MNKQDEELFNNSKKELELHLNIMIQHAPSQKVMLKLLEIERKLIPILENTNS